MHEYKLDVRIVRYKGIFDYAGLYRLVQTWLRDKEFEFHEKKYKEKPFHIGPETEVTWYAEKRVTGTIKCYVDIFFHLYDSVKTEVIIDGKKKEMVKGRISIDLWGRVVFDYSEEFERSNLAKKIEHFLRTTVLRKEILFKYLDPFDYELLDLETEIRKFLGMEYYESEWSKK